MVSISGMSGLFMMETQRDNGIIVKPFDDERRKFISSRQHMVTPLENITIYTSGEPAELKAVLAEMKRQEAELTPADPIAGNDELKDYFGKIVPDYDREKVYTSDIKKIMKWYRILDDAGLITLEAEVEEEKEPTDADKPDEPQIEKEAE